MTPFLNADKLIHGPQRPDEQQAFLEKYARAQKIADCLHGLEMMQRELLGRYRLLDTIMLNLRPVQNFLKDELEGTGLSSIVRPSHPSSPEAS